MPHCNARTKHMRQCAERGKEGVLRISGVTTVKSKRKFSRTVLDIPAVIF
jgi:hypothetical protein